MTDDPSKPSTESTGAAPADDGSSFSGVTDDSPPPTDEPWPEDSVSDGASTAGDDVEDDWSDERAVTDADSDDAADSYPWPSSDRTLGALVLITVVGLVARLVWLGQRVAHQDEGRVGYWIIRYLETGVWEYRPIVHGPFLFHVNKFVFQFFGPSDFTSRVAVALLGASMPLAAWLYRKHLRDTELVAFGLFLAFNPVLLYYSRFMREDVPLVVFVVFTLGFFLRYYDERQRRYLVAGVATFALAMTTKENALLYPICWLGAAALLLDHRLFRAPVRDDATVWGTFVAYLDWLVPFDLEGTAAAAMDARGDELVDRHVDWWQSRWKSVAFALALVVEFFAIIVLFYAPRGGGFTDNPPGNADRVAGFPGPEQAGEGIGLWNSLDQLASGDPEMFFTVVHEAIVGSWTQFTNVWAGGGHQDHSFLLFFEHYVDVLGAAALVLCVFAVVGFVVDRYSEDGPRDLVALASYWGFVSVLGYPIATDIRAGWATAHSIVPLAIPAAVGLAIVFRWGLDSFTDEDAVGVGLTVLVLLLVFGNVAATAVTMVYVDYQDPGNEVIQYAQSSSTDLKDTLADVERIGRERGGPDHVDVMFYGNEYYVTNESDNDQIAPGGGYYDRRTLMWYIETYEYRARQTDGQTFVTDSTLSLTQLNETRPSVVFAVGNGSNGDDAEEIHGWMLDHGYEAREFQRFLTENRTDEELGPGTPFMIYIDESALSASNDLDGPAENATVETDVSGPTATRAIAPDSTVLRPPSWLADRVALPGGAVQPLLARPAVRPPAT
ncbi:flippase activity-associated protein Agl23 [Haloarchaeobius sp. HRN-SO-5]|uniref:flippase activity-associated protein Agl23 n=1 Tax=Haloarchaeobius sp. HRN-SO-5 TaxID=3446118 RepID=UPI003EB7C68E